MADQYPCRTKTIEGVGHTITILNQDGQPSGISGPYDTLEAAQKAVDRLKEIGCEAKIKTHRWTKTVCIECGEERLG